MKKKLEEMTLEELWELFPIYLVENKYDLWKEYYNEIKNELYNLLKDYDVVINHIGSTSLKDIWAKPIIDVLIEFDDEVKMKEASKILSKNNFIIMNEKENRISLNRGYTEEGFAEKVYHIHLRAKGDNEEIAFRDYLENHEDDKKEYESLKLDLWKKFEHDRDGYTEAKSDFIKKIEKNLKK